MLDEMGAVTFQNQQFDILTHFLPQLVSYAEVRKGTAFELLS